MYTEALLISILILLGGFASGSAWAIGLGTTTCISALAHWGGAPRWASWTLWIWLTGILFGLIFFPVAASPGPAGPEVNSLIAVWLMLGGIWLVPVLIGPLAFLLSFRCWLSK